MDALLIGLAGHRAQQGIGLPAGQCQHADAQGGKQLLHQRELRPQLIRCGRAAGLIFIIAVVAEGGRVVVKGHHAVLGPLLAQDAQQHAEKAMHRVGGHPIGVHRRQGMKSPVHQAVSVYDYAALLQANHLRRIVS